MSSYESVTLLSGSPNGWVLVDLHQTLLSAYLQGAGPAQCLPLTALDWAKSRDLLLLLVVSSPL